MVHQTSGAQQAGGALRKSSRKPSKEYREALASLELMSAVVSARLRAGYTPTADELRAEDAAFDRLLHARQAYWQSVSRRET